MKFSFSIMYATVFALLSSSPVEALSDGGNDTIRVLILKDFPPQFVSTPDEPSGLAVDMVREVARRVFLKIEFVTVNSWKEVYAPLQDGTVDVLANLGVIEARRKIVDFTHPYEVFEIKFI